VSLATKYVKYMPKVFVDARDASREILSGRLTNRARWERPIRWTDEAIGNEMGKLYVARHFNEASKAKALAIIDAVKVAFRERVMEVDWIRDESTREEALKKIETLNTKIGYPDKWPSYSKLLINADDDFLSMIVKVKSFKHQLKVNGRLNKPVDRYVSAFLITFSLSSEVN